MTKVGVLHCEENMNTYNTLNKIIERNNHNIHVDLISEQSDENSYNILISNNKTNKLIIDKILCQKTIVILNIDEKFNNPVKFLSPVRIITYGFNPKACVTASSVISGEYNTIQYCIQRTIKTLNDKILYPQEFPINTHNKDPITVISAITTLILCGYDINQLRCNLFV